MEQWITVLSLVFNFLAAGGLVAFITIRQTVKKADAEAAKVEAEVETNKIDNVKDTIDVYKSLADDLRKELICSKSNYAEILTEMANLRKEVVKLTNVNKQMVKLLDKITPDNLTEMIDKIKQIHSNE